MQAIKSLVFFGLVVGLFIPQAHGKQIWESLDTFLFDFSKYNAVTISATLPEAQKPVFLNVLKKVTQDKAKIKILQDLIEAISFSSQLTVYFSFAVTENPNIHLLHMYATAPADLSINKEHFLATIWEKTYLFENRDQLNQDLSAALEEGLTIFTTQYFKTNSQAKDKAVFNFFFNI